MYHKKICLLQNIKGHKIYTIYVFGKFNSGKYAVFHFHFTLCVTTFSNVRNVNKKLLPLKCTQIMQYRVKRNNINCEKKLTFTESRGYITQCSIIPAKAPATM